MDLYNKTVLITGASSGIGQAIAIACAEKGARVIIHYRKNFKGARTTLAAVENFADGFLVQADLTKKPQVAKMFATLAKEVGQIDALINNAGEVVAHKLSDEKIWRAQFENLFFAPLACTNAYLSQKKSPRLRKVINISSIYGEVHSGNSGYLAYSAAKAALNNLTVTLAKTNANLRINAIAPGYTMTPMWAGSSKAALQFCADQTLIGRFVAPEEIAHSAVYLLENDATTGQVLTVDGGLGLKKI